MKYTKSSSEKDILFPGDNYRYNACLNYMQMDHVYIDGYESAGDILTDHIIKVKINQDGLVYPIIFCYRQCIELLVKKIVKNFQKLQDLELEIDKKHNILTLFRKYKSIFIIYLKEKDLQDCLAMIKRINTVDPESTATRYSTDLKGDQSIKIPDHILNIKTFSIEAKLVISFLHGVNDQIENKRVLKGEIDK